MTNIPSTKKVLQSLGKIQVSGSFYNILCLSLSPKCSDIESGLFVFARLDSFLLLVGRWKAFGLWTIHILETTIYLLYLLPYNSLMQSCMYLRMRILQNIGKRSKRVCLVLVVGNETSKIRILTSLLNIINNFVCKQTEFQRKFLPLH